MKDRFDNELELGDEVLYFHTSGSGVNVQRCAILSFSPKMVYIDCIGSTRVDPYSLVKYHWSRYAPKKGQITHVY